MRRVHGGAGGCPVGPSDSYTYDEGNTETTQNIQRRGKLPKTVMISQDVTFRQARITDTQESSIGGTWVGEPSDQHGTAQFSAKRTWIFGFAWFDGSGLG